MTVIPLTSRQNMIMETWVLNKAKNMLKNEQQDTRYGILLTTFADSPFFAFLLLPENAILSLKFYSSIIILKIA